VSSVKKISLAEATGNAEKRLMLKSWDPQLIILYLCVLPPGPLPARRLPTRRLTGRLPARRASLQLGERVGPPYGFRLVEPTARRGRRQRAWW